MTTTYQGAIIPGPSVNDRGDPHRAHPTRVRLRYREYFLFTGHVEDALHFVPEKSQTPNLWWPQDRSWCVASEIDDFVTYIAGSTALIEQLRADQRLETQPAQEGEPKFTTTTNPPPPS